MADYNIYIRNIGGGSGGESSPTTPFQVGGGDGFAAKDTGQFISKAGSIVQTPDSAFSMAGNVGVGVVSGAFPWIGIAILVATVLYNTANSIYEKYNNYVTTATGNYDRSTRYSNVKNMLSRAMKPYTAEVQRQMAVLEMKKANAKNEQEMSLFGGTVLNSPYGRYL